jgi:hypothetical protein
VAVRSRVSAILKLPRDVANELHFLGGRVSESDGSWAGYRTIERLEKTVARRWGLGARGQFVPASKDKTVFAGLLVVTALVAVFVGHRVPYPGGRIVHR